MGTIFENSFKFTKELFIQLFKDLYKLYRLVLLIIGAAFLVFAFLSIGGYFVATVVLFVFAAYFIYMSVGGYLIRADRTYKQLLAQNCDEENVYKIQFTDEEFSNDKSSYRYDQIKKVSETKDLIILLTDKHGTIPLKKDCFTIGTLQEFKKFIGEKCVNARILYK